MNTLKTVAKISEEAHIDGLVKSKSAKERAEQYVRAKCPELMELSFGCRIHDNNEPLDWAKAQIIVHYDLEKSVLVARESDGSTYRKSTKLEGYEIIGHPIQLQHWLISLPLAIDIIDEIAIRSRYLLVPYKGRIVDISFDLTTGQPATEADYQAFLDIVGV